MLLCLLLCCSPPTALAMLETFVKLKPGDIVVQNGANSSVGQVGGRLGIVVQNGAYSWVDQVGGRLGIVVQNGANSSVGQVGGRLGIVVQNGAYSWVDQVGGKTGHVYIKTLYGRLGGNTDGKAFAFGPIGDEALYSYMGI